MNSTVTPMTEEGFAAYTERASRMRSECPDCGRVCKVRAEFSLTPRVGLPMEFLGFSGGCGNHFIPMFWEVTADNTLSE